MKTSKTVLGLNLPTDPRWADLAGMNLQDILTDHAYCEQKAASTIISIIQLHPDREKMVTELSPVVTEEWGHFRMVLSELKKRGLKLGYQRKDEYIKKLYDGRTKSGDAEKRFLDKLLMCALIEARSCERFRTLSRKLTDPDLQEFYHKFMVAEAGHYKLFLNLSKHYFGNDKTMQRWQEWLDYEAGFLPDLTVRGDRMH